MANRGNEPNSKSASAVIFIFCGALLAGFASLQMWDIYSVSEDMRLPQVLLSVIFLIGVALTVAGISLLFSKGK